MRGKRIKSLDMIPRLALEKKCVVPQRGGRIPAAVMNSMMLHTVQGFINSGLYIYKKPKHGKRK